MVVVDFARRRFVAQISENSNFQSVHTFLCVAAQRKRCRAKSFGTNIGTILTNMPINLKRKLDIVEKPENRVHRPNLRVSPRKSMNVGNHLHSFKIFAGTFFINASITVKIPGMELRGKR